MAELIGIAPETLTRWLASGGMPNPRLVELEEIASALGLTLAELVEESGASRPEPKPVPEPPVNPRVRRALQRLLDAYDEVATIAKELGRGE